MQQQILPLTPVETPSFENFIVGENLATVAALQAFLHDNRIRSFVLWGGAGVGKSHLLKASGEQDDLSVLDVNQIDEDLAHTLFVAFTTEPHKRFLISLREPLRTLSLREDLKTRLLMGHHYSLSPLNEQAVLAAVDAETLRRGFLLGKEVVAYLLNHWQRDIRSLLMVIDGLDQLSLQHHRRITVPLLKDWLASQ